MSWWPMRPLLECVLPPWANSSQNSRCRTTAIGWVALAPASSLLILNKNTQLPQVTDMQQVGLYAKALFHRRCLCLMAALCNIPAA